jgi:CheY-like chemotaxis protein
MGEEGVAWLTFVVEDTGRGIREEDIERIFVEYRRVDINAANYHIEGTGLGLFICKRLTEMMDGTIHATSKYGMGSQFTMRIHQKVVDPTPIDERIIRNLERVRLLESYGRTRLPHSAYMPYGKVLIVDDVPTNLDVARALLSLYGLTIHCASSGMQAINIIREEKDRYDIVFMDHMMPEMDGIEAVRIIRDEIKTEYARTVPIIALTANAIVGNAEKFLQNGFQAFLPKPVDTAQLDSLLNQFIRNKQSEETLRQAALAKQLLDTSATLENTVASIASPKHNIRGLDFDDGLRRFGGNETSYFSLLQSYVTHVSTLLNEIRNVTNVPPQQYVIKIHGIKGASYGISANELGKMAEDLEGAAKNADHAFVEKHHPAFMQHAEQLMNDLSDLLKRELKKTDNENKPRKDEPDKNLLLDLLDACTRFKMTRIQKIVDELDAYAYDSDPHLTDWLRKQANNLEYGIIRKRLEKILGQGEFAGREGSS